MNDVEPFRLGTTTLLDYLSGSWTVTRALQDHAADLTGTFTGTATFRFDGVLHHRESGMLTWAGMAPASASRDLVWRSAGSSHSLEVFFPDGRFFHGLDLTTGEDSPAHLCSPDTYRGHFVLQDADRWQYTWRVGGPHKDLTLKTRLTRTGAGSQTLQSG